MRFLLPFLIVFVLITCAPSKPVYVTASWVNKNMVGKKKYHKIYVIGLLHQKSVNSILENEIQNNLVPRGFDVWRNQDVFPYEFETKEIARKATIEKIKQVGCDGVLVIALKDVQIDSAYTGGSSVVVSGYSPTQGAFQQPTADSPYPKQEYYANFNNYYYNYQTVSSKPGYYVTDRNYFIETNFFDASGGEILFSIQSKAVNPKDIEKASQLYCTEILTTLQKEGVLKSKK